MLTGYYAQTYDASRHNFSEHFIFDPFLDPNVPQTLLDELTAQDIRFIHAYDSLGNPVITLYPAEAACQPAEPIPALSEWGLVAMTLLVLTAGTLVYARPRPDLRRGSGCQQHEDEDRGKR